MKFTQEERIKISNRFNNKCNICKCCITKDTKFDVDHIRALSNGRTNEKSNLQSLCKLVKCITWLKYLVSMKRDNSHNTTEYIIINDTQSTFNTQVHKILNINEYSIESESDSCIYRKDLFYGIRRR